LLNTREELPAYKVRVKPRHDPSIIFDDRCRDTPWYVPASVMALTIFS
jgi:hypothetical protein